MNLDGARNAKADIFRHAFGFIETDGPPGSVLPTFVPPWLEPEPWTGWPGLQVEEYGRRFGRLDEDGAGVAGGVFSDLPLSRAPHGSIAAVVLPSPPIAVGIMPLKRQGAETRVVLFAEDDRFRNHPIVLRALALARGARFVACGENRALSFWMPARRRPLLLGVSVAHRNVTAGSLGTFTRRRRDGAIGILSNNHVLAAVNQGVPHTDEVLQPGRGDGGRPGHDMVALLDGFVVIDTAPNAVNLVDCAVATLATDMEPGAAFAGRTAGMPLALKGWSDAVLFEDEMVFKVGRTTGPTEGLVFATEVDNYIVNMGTAMAPLRCRFDNQLQVYATQGDFARAGDSGSVVFDEAGLARGLLFAGSRTGAPSGFGLAAVNPIGPVLAQLDVEVWVK